MLGPASNTIVAYGRGIEGFLVFCQSRSIDVRRASREVIAQYVHHLRTQPRNGRDNVIYIDSGASLSNATLQQRLTAVRMRGACTRSAIS
jgi:integrase/recombinase XerD